MVESIRITTKIVFPTGKFCSFHIDDMHMLTEGLDSNAFEF